MFSHALSQALSPDFANDSALYAGTEEHGLFTSADRGRTWTRLGEDTITDTVNQIIPSSTFPARPDILVLLSTVLLISRDKGSSWDDWKADLSLAEGATAVAAPQGLDPGSPLLLGLVERGVLSL